MPQKKRRRRRNVDADVLAEIQVQALIPNVNAAGIQRTLESDERFRARVPSIRSVQDIVRELSVTDASGAWTLSDATEDEASLVLPVLRALLIDGTGPARVSKDEAKWVVRVQRAKSGLPAMGIYLLARMYLIRDRNHETVDDLDKLLALQPWAASDRLKATEKLAESGDLSRQAWLLGHRLSFESVQERHASIVEPPSEGPTVPGSGSQ